VDGRHAYPHPDWGGRHGPIDQPCPGCRRGCLHRFPGAVDHRRATRLLDRGLRGGANSARFGFTAAPVDLQVTVSAEPDKLVRIHVTSGFPFWEGSTWEWEIGSPGRTDTGTGVLFRHHEFGDGYAETDLAYTAQTWAMILARLARYVTSGTPQPYFPETPA